MSGERIGVFRICRQLGHGGMGIVYEVEAPDGTHLALKRFAADEKNRAFLAKRFRAEAKLLIHLEDPHLVRVHEIGECDGAPFFTMDLVLNAHGEPETLEDARKRGGIRQEEAERWFREIAGVLSRLHARGIVHRDVKLENVLLDAEGHALLSDFGISRICDETMRAELNVTKTFIEGQTTGTRPVMGTYFYLAPELRAGGEATPASDWYALGVLFFRFLTGIWYEPSLPRALDGGKEVSPFDLLLPFDAFWRTNLPRLLSPDPEERAPAPDPVQRAARNRLPAILIGLVIGILTLATISAVFLLFDRAPPSRSPAASPAIPGVLEINGLGDWVLVDRASVTSLVVNGTLSLIPNESCAFWPNLRRVEIREGVQKIGICAFFGCSNLVSVAIPDSCTHIRGYAFGDCVSLRNVRCGAGLLDIGRSAFGGCRSLQTVLFAGNAPNVSGIRLYANTPTTLVTRVRAAARGWSRLWPENDETSRPVETLDPEAWERAMKGGDGE